nr:Rrf2 family transcriptional regulator [Caproiciproducens faecalis]
MITRETDYALRILRAMASGEQVTTGDICKRELLPQQFVYKILKKLERANLVQITRGVGGGCRLVADLNNVSLYDLTEIMDAEKLISACMQPGFQCAWQQKCSTPCTVHRQIFRIQEILDTELRAVSLHRMLLQAEDE